MRPASAPSIISADVQLKGNLNTSGEVQFDGSIEGDIKAGALTVGESATVTGSITAETVVVNGQIIGTVRAKTVRLQKGSKLVGDVFHEDLAVESGAHIEGSVAKVDNAIEKTAAPQKIEAPKADATAPKVS